MNVTQYTFQSPSPSQVQVGKPDPSSQTSNSTSTDDSKQLSTINPSVSEAESFQASQTKEVKPAVDSGHTLDIYA